MVETDTQDKCQLLKEELSALLDNQVSGSLKSEIEDHLLTCEACTKEFESLKGLVSLLGKALVPEDAQIPDIWGALSSSSMPSVCDVIQEDLSAYLDGELTAPAQEGVNKHLKECETCLGKFKDINDTNRLLAKGLELPAAIEIDLWSGVKSRLNADCALIDNELSAYLDQEVVTLRHREITKHLTDCQTCQEDFNKLSSVGDLIRDAYKPEIPDNFDLWPGIKSKLQVVQFTPKAQPKQAKGIPKKYYVLAASAAAFVLFFGLGAVWLNSPGESSVKRVSAEEYLINSSLLEPADKAEANIYDE